MVDSIIDKLNWTHFNPVRIVCEPLESLANHTRGEHILLVTTPGFIKRGAVDRVKKILSNQRVSVWDGVKPNPDLMDLDEATEQLKPLKPDCIIGLGGGSALDAAKVLATTLAHADSHSLTEVFRHCKNPTWNKRLPLIAIPTTAGTGSEVTPFATVWDHEEKKKHSLTGDYVFPDVALLDATLTLTLGYEDTLYPALDTISHALESLWNKNITPISKSFSLGSLKLSSEALLETLDNPSSLNNRHKLLQSSCLAGLAISQTKTAIAHATSYSLTVKYGIPHGLACSFALSELIEKSSSLKHIKSEDYGPIQEINNILKGINFNQLLIPYMKNLYHFSTSDIVSNQSRAQNYLGDMDFANSIVNIKFNTLLRSCD